MSLIRARQIVADLRMAIPYLPEPILEEQAQAVGATFSYDQTRRLPVITIPPTYEPGEAKLREVVTHECGHMALDALGRTWDAIAALRAFALYHGADAAIADDLKWRHELWAEHFARAFAEPYDGSAYPQLVGRVPFRSAADSRSFFVDPRRYALMATSSVEERTAAFWRRVDAMAPTDHLTAADLGSWAQNLIERDRSARISVADFRSCTTEMQAAIDRARAT